MRVQRGYVTDEHGSLVSLPDGPHGRLVGLQSRMRVEHHGTVYLGVDPFQ